MDGDCHDEYDDVDTDDDDDILMMSYMLYIYFNFIVCTHLVILDPRNNNLTKR